MFSWISELTAPYRKKLSALSTAMRVLIFASVAAVAVFISIAAVGARFAYKVSLEGEYIATVKSKEQFKAAVNIVKEKVTGDNVESKVSTPEYSAVIALNNDIDSNQNVAEAIIEKTEDIVLASDIKIEGTEIGYVNKDELQSVIDGIYAAKAPEGSTCSFVENVEISDGYCLASEVAGAEEAAQMLSGLNVKAVATVVTDIETGFKTVTKKTNTQTVDYRQIETEGKNGLRRVTDEIVYLNGEEQSRTCLSDEVLSTPVDQVVVVGTAKTSATAAQMKIAKSSGFIFPLPNGVWQVSCYYGNGGHKGIDLRAPKGTQVFAVASGKVVFSGYDGSYGNCIRIDHGNGLVTTYAHASQLCARVGETVNAGEVIALVGSTGYSTGNHLHFEVHCSGTRVNPAPFIGIS